VCVCACVRFDTSVITVTRLSLKAFVLLFARIKEVRCVGYAILSGNTSLGGEVQTLPEVFCVFPLYVGLRWVSVWLHRTILRDVLVQFYVMFLYNYTWCSFSFRFVMLIIWAYCILHVDIFLYNVRFSSSFCVVMSTYVVMLTVIFPKIWLCSKFNLSLLWGQAMEEYRSRNSSVWEKAVFISLMSLVFAIYQLRYSL
jgi:hypothetical protein